MTRLLATTVVLLFAAVAAPAMARAQSEVAPDVPIRLFIEDALSGPSPVLEALDAIEPLAFPVAARLRGSFSPDERSALDARLEEYASRGIAVWLVVPAPARAEDVDAWRSDLDGLVRTYLSVLQIVEIRFDGQAAALVAYVVRVGATEIRSRGERIQIALGGVSAGTGGALSEAYTAGLAPYLDLVALPPQQARAGLDLLARVDSDARVVTTGMVLGTDGDGARRSMLDGVLETLGTAVTAQAWAGTGDVVAAALPALAPLAALITGDTSSLDAAAVSLELSVGPDEVTDSIRHRLLLEGRSFGTYLVYWGDARPEPLSVSLLLPNDGVPVVHDLERTAQRQAAAYARDRDTGVARAQVPLTGGPMLVDFNEGALEIFGYRTGVSGELQLSVEEIIARHQLQQRTQDALVQHYTARVRMDQHFRPNMADPGYDVVTDNRYYVAQDGIEWEELSFSVNGATWGSDRPPFPLLQPEKVLSLPLQLRFTNEYAYRLAGTDRVGDYDCYVVRFEPLVEGSSLFRGSLWIDRRTFARVRVQAVQTQLSAPVVSNEETQTYGPVAAIDGRPIFLFTGLTARQIVLMAGRNILVEKSVAFSDFEINGSGFQRSRASARDSDRVMYRETDLGLRYYVKDGERRVISDRQTSSVRALAMGVTLDPSYSFPLPMVGINYLDFEFGDSSTQLALLFAGVLAAGNVQRPQIGSSPLDASVDFFAIGVPSTDRLIGTGGEREAERVLMWPLSTGLNVGWQYTPFQKATFQYQFRFDAYMRERTTSDTFTVPSSTTTNGLGGAWEYRRGGYSLGLTGTWFGRSSWGEWGEPALPGSDAPGPAPVRAYKKYSASLTRDFFFNVFHKVHLNAAWFGGRDQDRFAKYQFGMFDDTRIHGVPASGLRFENLAMVRGSYSLNVFEQYRLDVFLDRAWGHDRAVADTWQSITGLGAAVNLRAPWNTMLRTDLGKSFLPDYYRDAGSMTLQIMLLKPLR